MKNKKVLLVQNIARESGGLVEDVLKEKNIQFNIANLDQGDEFPAPINYSAIFVFGGPDSANDKTPKMQNEIKRIKEAIDAKIPYFGVCLGMQTLVKSIGGEVYKNPIKEIGWRDPKGDYFEINLTNEGMKDSIFKGIKSPLKMFQLHGEAVNLRDGMTLLAEGEYCKNQVLKVGDNAYGFQCHLELNKPMFERWIKEDADLKNLDINKLRGDYNKLKSEYERNGRTIINNFWKYVRRY